MPESSPFMVKCQDCEMSRETDDLSEALTFAVKHQQHTGHSVRWKESNLIDGTISIPKRIRWKVECNSCDAKRIFREEDRAEQFYEEHEEYAGHSPDDLERIELPKLSEIDPSDINVVIEYCFEQADSVEAIPEEAIIEAFEEAGVDQKWISRAIDITVARSDVYHLGGGLLAR